MKTAISIPDELFRAAEKAARRMKLSRSELYRRALAQYLEKQRDSLITETLNEVYATGQPGRVDAVLDRMQRASLVREDW
jgi:metal-responsive CopG/Arc/MetJ family transcriptional regulator